MPWRPNHSLSGALALVFALLAPAGAARAQSSVSKAIAVAAPAPARSPGTQAFLGRSDAVFGLVTVATVAITMHNDVWLRSEALESDTRLDRDLARALQPLGNPVFVLPVLLAGFGPARVMDAPERAVGFGEVGVSVLAAGAGALVVKEVVGRARPEDSPNDHLSFKPFSGQVSFPSGHATVAFALAESINLTSGSRWAPWLTYPTAALVGWSRVRDDHHWTSDVVAGAALGIWTARKVHQVFPAERHLLSRLGFATCTPDGVPGLLVTLR